MSFCVSLNSHPQKARGRQHVISRSDNHPQEGAVVDAARAWGEGHAHYQGRPVNLPRVPQMGARSSCGKPHHREHVALK